MQLSLRINSFARFQVVMSGLAILVCALSLLTTFEISRLNRIEEMPDVTVIRLPDGDCDIGNPTFNSPTVVSIGNGFLSSELKFRNQAAYQPACVYIRRGTTNVTFISIQTDGPPCIGIGRIVKPVFIRGGVLISKPYARL